MDIRQVGVIGCGLMGSGIAEVCARSGYDTLVREVNQELLDKGLARIQKSLDTAVARGKLGQADRDAAWGRIRGTTRMGDLADRDLVIEAATENPGIKKET